MKRPSLGRAVEFIVIASLLGSAGTYLATLIQVASIETHLSATRAKVLARTPQVALRFRNDELYVTKDKEWEALVQTYAPQMPNTTLDPTPSGTIKMTSLYQTIHCLDVIRTTYLSMFEPHIPRRSMREEAEMCIDQFRQNIECVGDMALEPTVIKRNDFKPGHSPGNSGAQVTHRCEDWRVLQTTQVDVDRSATY